MKRLALGALFAVLVVSWFEQALTIMVLRDENENLRNYS